MARSALSAPAVAALAFALAGCDWLPRQWPFATQPSSVTVKLPPVKRAAPGFAFNESRKTAPMEIHEAREER
jgi:hypothetical protein